MLVRSVFNRSFMNPAWVPGNLSIQLMQRWPVFLHYTRDPAGVGQDANDRLRSP
jgi:hypothetical protein